MVAWGGLKRGILTMWGLLPACAMTLNRRTFNPKRRICTRQECQSLQEVLSALLEDVRYGGNPEHKRNPGDFGLAPPSAPRPGKTLCDEVQIFTRTEALKLLRISADDLKEKPSVDGSMGLAVRTGRWGSEVAFSKKNRPARRFEAARFIADYLSAAGSDRWLPITDAATARQKLQRAFAAEFLCPIDSLRSYLGDEFLPQDFEDAAEYFGISETAIKSHLANHYLIPRRLVDSDPIC